MVTRSVQQLKAQVCQCTLWICPHVPMPTQQNVSSTSTHLWKALKLLKGLSVGKLVNVLGPRPKVSLVLYQR